MTSVAVIIPYFQLNPGILRRTLKSVLAQQLLVEISVHIIVVDDGSKAAVQDEIEGLEITQPFRLTIVSQPNQGVATARNSGLRCVENDTSYIAFLDFDDIWNGDHLAKGIQALDEGYDLYFCDHGRLNHHASHFMQVGNGILIGQISDGPINKFAEKANKEKLFHYSLRYFLAQLSTVIFRREIASHLTFNEKLDAAGEDALFVLNLINGSRRICFSRLIHVTCADGVNIYYSRFSWEDSGHLLRVFGIILMYEQFKSLPLSKEDQTYLSSIVTKRRLFFTFLALRYFLKKRELWPIKLRQMTRHDPNFLFWYPACLVYVLLGLCFHLYTPMVE